MRLSPAILRATLSAFEKRLPAAKAQLEKYRIEVSDLESGIEECKAALGESNEAAA